ncbi:hypothetical protein B0H14DRAFT_2613006 [Mycena olivaceomarginata]|nr:hypothetical protein B0H14DRAFT_2613006 [Mycena olivaceomarginata]
MSRNYALRPNFTELNSDDFADEPDAASTIGAASSPPGQHLPDIHMRTDIPWGEMGSDDFLDEDSDADYGSNTRARKSSDLDKTLAVLEFMKDYFPRFSLKNLLTVLFTSDNPSIKNVTNTYLAMDGALHLLETAVGDKGLTDNDVADWVMMQAATICTGEVHSQIGPPEGNILKMQNHFVFQQTQLQLNTFKHSLPLVFCSFMNEPLVIYSGFCKQLLGKTLRFIQMRLLGEHSEILTW